MTVEYRKEGRVAYFTFNRPDGTNLIDIRGMQEYSEAMTDFQNDPDLWVGIITGKGKRVFCAGADLKEAFTLMRDRDIGRSEPPMPQRGMEVWKPLIAAINGLAIGGGLEIALACDIRIAAENARLGLPEVTLGLMPGWGGTQRLPRLIPWCKAAELIFTGKIIDASEALRINLVNSVVPYSDLMSTAAEYAEDICRVSPLAVQMAKRAMIKGCDVSLEKGLELENDLLSQVLKTDDFTEGIAAYATRRRPAFKGR